MEEHTARFAEVLLIYEGKDISRDVAPYLISFQYTDNASDKADDISFTLEDRKRLWCNDWFPTKGDKVKASIVLHNWQEVNRIESLPCGTFEIDQIECSGPPNQVTIKAISTLISKPMRAEKHTKAWENVKLSIIASDIANKNGLEFFWDCSDDPLFERRDQIETSDLEFISQIGKDYGISVKVTDTQLVCYSTEEYETKSPVGELQFGDKKLLRWNFSSKATGTYKAATLQYHDPVKNRTIKATVNSDSTEATGSGRVLMINQKADSEDDAKKIAKQRLDDANKKEITGNISLMGDLRYVGGSNVKITGFGSFDGVFTIESATHSVSGSGYTTGLNISMGKESKKDNATKKSKKRAASKKRTVSTDTAEKVYAGEKRKLFDPD